MLNNLLGDDPKRKNRLTKEEAAAWNKFRQENPDLQKEADLKVLYQRYKQRYPKGTISLPALNNEFALTDRYLKQEAAYRRNANPQDAHSGFTFPIVRNEQGAAVDLVTGDAQVHYPTTDPNGRPLKTAAQIPVDAQWGFNAKYGLPYFLNENGDIEYAEQNVWNDPKFADFRAQDGGILNSAIDEATREEMRRRLKAKLQAQQSNSATNPSIYPN